MKQKHQKALTGLGALLKLEDDLGKVLPTIADYTLHVMCVLHLGGTPECVDKVNRLEILQMCMVRAEELGLIELDSQGRMVGGRPKLSTLRTLREIREYVIADWDLVDQAEAVIANHLRNSSTEGSA